MPQASSIIRLAVQVRRLAKPLRECVCGRAPRTQQDHGKETVAATCLGVALRCRRFREMRVELRHSPRFIVADLAVMIRGASDLSRGIDENVRSAIRSLGSAATPPQASVAAIAIAWMIPPNLFPGGLGNLDLTIEVMLR